MWLRRQESWASVNKQRNIPSAKNRRGRVIGITVSSVRQGHVEVQQWVRRARLWRLMLGASHGGKGSDVRDNTLLPLHVDCTLLSAQGGSRVLIDRSRSRTQRVGTRTTEGASILYCLSRVGATAPGAPHRAHDRLNHVGLLMVRALSAIAKFRCELSPRRLSRRETHPAALRRSIIPLLPWRS